MEIVGLMGSVLVFLSFRLLVFSASLLLFYSSVLSALD